MGQAGADDGVRRRVEPVAAFGMSRHAEPVRGNERRTDECYLAQGRTRAVRLHSKMRAAPVASDLMVPTIEGRRMSLLGIENG